MANNIQKYRKQLGFSQDELAQKLLVSRQTISQWETGQTMPTTDNLIRLKDIFGVSIDDVLGFTAQSDANDTPAATEHYTFNFTQIQIAVLYEQNRKNAVYPILKPAILNVLLAVWMAFNQSWIAVGALVGVLFILALIIIIRIRAVQKTKREAMSRVPSSTYEYEAFKEYFIVKIYRNDELITSAKYYYADIQKISLSGSLLLVTVGSQLYLFNKDELSPSSIFLYLYARQNAQSEEKPLHKTVSVCLVIASIASLFLSIVVVSKFSSGCFSSLLLFWAFLPIPLTSVIAGIVLKRKGYPKYRKNIIVGIIFAVLLAGFGTLGSVQNISGFDNPAAFQHFEELSQIDFPEPKRIINMPYDENNTEITNLDEDLIEPVCITYVHFSQSNKEIEALVKNNSHWQHPPNKELLALLMPIYFEKDIYVCFYNEDENTFNTVPSKPGRYHIYAAVYHPENGLLETDEYYLKYS